MLYYKIDSSNKSDYSVKKEPKLPDGREFVYGMKMDGPVPAPLVFEVDFPSKDDLPHFVAQIHPVLSDVLVKTIQSAGVENFQIFPAILRNPEVGIDWDGYWMFHEFGLIAAANLEKSKADTIMGGSPGGVSVPLMGFHTLVLDKEKTRNVSMFRLAESPGLLLVHERVMSHIRANRPAKGWGFVSTEVEAI